MTTFSNNLLWFFFYVVAVAMPVAYIVILAN